MQIVCFLMRRLIYTALKNVIIFFSKLSVINCFDIVREFVINCFDIVQEFVINCFDIVREFVILRF